MHSSLTPRSHLVDRPVIVIGGEPRREELRMEPRQPRVVRLPPPVLPAKSRGTAGLSMMTVALGLMLVWALWQWHQASAKAEAAEGNAEMSWAFADGVLDDLKSVRADASRLDADRKDLIRLLAQTQQERQALKGEVYTWQEEHRALETEAQKALTKWSAYGQQLEQNLGSARTQLNETSTALQQERTVAQQQISELAEQKDSLVRAKEDVEREATALDRMARSLNNDNQQLQGEVSSLNGDVSRLRNCVSSLESDKSSLLSSNASLASENSRLRCEVGDLQSRIRCLEGELSRAKDDSSRSKR